MRNQLVYDLPLRIFHWLFASLFITAFLIAKNVDDESSLFFYHMLAGLVLGFTVLLRLFWGIVGSKYSRFKSFALHPMDVLAYFAEMLSGGKRRWKGHNPASSWASLLMFGLALGLGATGYLMASGQKETFEDIHELMANAFLVVVLLHVAGVVLHGLRHQDGIAMSMIDGSKDSDMHTEGISSARPGIALLFVGLVLTFATYLIYNFDSQKQTLKIFATTLQLGEIEGNENAGGEKAEQESKESDDD